MGMPRKLKNMTLFNNGTNYMGQVTEVVPPKLKRKMEEYRAGGMNAPVKTDHGQEVMEMQWKCGGLMDQVLRQYAAIGHADVQLRFAGAYQRDDTGAVDAVQIVVRGRHEEIDTGTAKPGDNTEFSVTSTLSYYKLTINNEDIIEIDVINMIEKVNGVDMLAAQRRALGMA